MRFNPDPQPGVRRLIQLAAAGLVALGLSTALGCATAAPQQEVAPAEPAAALPAAEAPAAEAAETPPQAAPHDPTMPTRRIEYPEPPDGQWLIDETGREYFVMRIEKLEGQYRWMDDDTVRVRGGMMFDIAGHDEEAFWMKVYRVDPVVTRRQPPSREEIARIEAAYEVDLPVADGLRFAPFSAGLPESGQWRNGFELADMNGDGHLDIVHGPPRKGAAVPFVFLGDGAGSWRRWESVRFPAVALDYGDVAVADFNGDGHQDLALAVHLRGGIVFVGDGEGRFEPWTEGIPLDDFDPGKGMFPTFSSRQVEALDWNRDGRADLIFLSEGPVNVDLANQKDRDFGKVVFLNQGDGRWTRAEAPPSIGASSFGDTLLLADFDGDGRTDFAHSSGVIGDRALVNLAPAEAGAPWRPVLVDPVRPRSYVWAVGAGDFDADGRDDLLVSYTSLELAPSRSGLDLMLSRPAPDAGAAADGTAAVAWERRPLWSGTGEERWHALGAGDLDGDGGLEVVALEDDGRMMVLRRAADGGWVREEDPPPAEAAAQCRGVAVRLVDLDGRPGAEIVAGFAGEPGSEVTLDPTHRGECRHNGSLRAWTVEPLAAGGDSLARRRR
jgi:hypothetical protein